MCKAYLPVVRRNLLAAREARAKGKRELGVAPTATVYIWNLFISDDPLPDDFDAGVDPRPAKACESGYPCLRAQ